MDVSSEDSPDSDSESDGTAEGELDRAENISSMQSRKQLKSHTHLPDTQVVQVAELHVHDLSRSLCDNGHEFMLALRACSRKACPGCRTSWFPSSVAEKLDVPPAA